MREQWLNIFKDIQRNGRFCSPRGQRILEIENYQFDGDPFNRFCNFKERKLSLRYLFAEMAWYFAADNNDTRIEYYSKFWKTIKDQNQSYYNSNYGYYIYKQNGFNYIVGTLINDIDSRQATIMICNNEVMQSNSKDKLCTYSLNFRIRENKLNMSVNMRSCDAIRGLTIDYFQFSIIYEMIYIILKEKAYKDLEIGIYNHKCDSLHVYEKYFTMLDKIIENNTNTLFKANDQNSFTEIQCPKISSTNEVYYLLENFERLEELVRKKNIIHEQVLLLNNYQFTLFALNSLKN